MMWIRLLLGKKENTSKSLQPCKPADKDDANTLIFKK